MGTNMQSNKKEVARRKPLVPDWLAPFVFVISFILTYISIIGAALSQTVISIFWVLSPNIVHSLSCGILPIFWSPILIFWSAQSPIVVTGDVDEKGCVPNTEKAFLIVNHRSYIDWMAIMLLGQKSGVTGNIKIFVKDVVKYVPFLGISLKMMGYVFLTRSWDSDYRKLQKTFAFLKQVQRPFWLMSHLEGTRITPKKLEASQKFSRERGLPVLQHVLLPRVKGFTGAMAQLHTNLDCVYDITLAYPEGNPSVWKCVAGTETRATHLHVRRITLDMLPDPSDTEALKQWCYDLFKSKDELLAYWEKHKRFPDNSSTIPVPRSTAATSTAAAGTISADGTGSSSSSNTNNKKQQRRKIRKDD